jgi:hypothetical protein
VPVLAISFLFLGQFNNIDFLRRFGECSSRWVVGDIEAAIDVTAAEDICICVTLSAG